VQVILAGFRAGRFQVLVATNVAARGLDISDVQLIIQVFIVLLLCDYSSICNYNNSSSCHIVCRIFVCIFHLCKAFFQI
jgi:Helicase conserved C-terminal domain